MAYKNIEDARRYAREWQARYRKEKRAKHAAYMREYTARPEVKERVNARDRVRNSQPARKRQIRNARLKKLYGITADQYDVMLLAQNGVCDICKNPPRGKGTTNLCLHVDHNHTTGAVRSLLCSACNMAIGMLEENPDYAENLCNYLRKYSLKAVA